MAEMTLPELQAALSTITDLTLAIAQVAGAAKHLSNAVDLAAANNSPTVELKMSVIGLGSALATVNKYLPEQSP